MLTLGTECKLDIFSFLTLPHQLNFFICAKYVIIIVLLLQIMFVYLYKDLSGGKRVRYHIFSIALFCFCAVVNCSFKTGA